MKKILNTKIAFLLVMMLVVVVSSGCNSTTEVSDGGTSDEGNGDIYATYFSGYESVEEIIYSEDVEEGEEILTLVKDDSGELMGAVSQVSRRGYAGPIEFWVVINSQGAIEAIEIIEHEESTGLGDGIEEDSFRDQFVGKSNGDSLELEIDIDVVTNATISTKAIVEGVEASLHRAAEHLN